MEVIIIYIIDSSITQLSNAENKIINEWLVQKNLIITFDDKKSKCYKL